MSISRFFARIAECGAFYWNVLAQSIEIGVPSSDFRPQNLLSRDFTAPAGDADAPTFLPAAGKSRLHSGNG
jgi:hypothetical protein